MPLDSELLIEIEGLKKQHEILEDKIKETNSRLIASSEAFFQLRKQVKESNVALEAKTQELIVNVKRLLGEIAVLKQETQALSNKIDANLLNRVNP